MTDFYSETLKGPHRVLELGDLELELGGVLAGGRLAYKTHGTLSPARDNAILYPHMYASTPSSLEPTIAPGRALDPERWFVICPAMLGGGFSSSPSNTDGEFPELTIGDDVRAQALLLEHLGVDRLALALGFSMGAQQAYEWAVRFPDRVDRLAAIAGTARTTAANALQVKLAQEALAAGGLRLHARVWASLGLSAELYRSGAWVDAGFTSVDDLVGRLFEDDFGVQDPGNLASMCRKWVHADVSRHAEGDFAAALGRIGARTVVVAFSHDQLFPVADCEADAQLIPGAELHVIDSPCGHWAFEMTEPARNALDDHLSALLAR